MVAKVLSGRRAQRKGSWGGRREGAGRPNLSGRRAHVRRPKLRGETPLLVSFDVLDHVPDLRRPDLVAVFRESARSARECGFSLHRYGVRAKRIDLLVEAASNRTLERGMKSFSIRMALGVKKRIRPGRAAPTAIFKGRFELQVLADADAVRRALARTTTHNDICMPPRTRLLRVGMGTRGRSR